MKTKRFPEMVEFKPDAPQITDEQIAVKIANAIYDDVNIEEIYWTEDERQDIIDKMTSMIIRRQAIGDLFYHLRRAQPPIDDRGNRAVYPFGYEGVEDYPNAMLQQIANGVLETEIAAFNERYGT
jgi:hypothetical protein